MSANTADSASQLVDRLVNDAPFRESVAAAPTLHDKAQLIIAAGYGDVNMDAIQAAVKKQLAALGAGVQVDPARAKRTEELFLKAATDQELQQALEAAATPEAAREVLARAGYGDITLDDLRAAAARIGQREELSDAELELVSGGGAAGEWLGAGVAGLAIGAGIGAAAGGPFGAAVGGLVGFFTVAAPGLAEVPPPSQW